MSIEYFLNWESFRMDAYIQLSECYSLPDKEIGLKVKKMDRDFQTLNSDMLYQINLLRKEDVEQNDIAALKIDYSRLFIGPYSLLAPPYGSVYLERKRQIMEDSTMDTIKRYADAGLTMSESFKDIPDHIRAELEFMHFLIVKGMASAVKGDTIELTSILERQLSFLENHLCAWISDFADNVMNNAKTSFYQNLARTTEAFVQDDHRAVSAMLSGLHPVELNDGVDTLQTPC